MKKIQHNGDIHKLTGAGLLIALGIIYGDIGTSPLYVMSAVIGGNMITKDLVYGALSCVFWTLMLLTTFKYVALTLQADNKGEGGTFALYALVRRRSKYLIYFALIGGSALLADSIITPPISVSAAVEGLLIIDPSINTLPIVICILILLFLIQGFGTSIMGNAFGPVMLIWFLMIGSLGVIQIFKSPEVLQAINPYYAIRLLVHYPHGFWLLGSVFLCATGGEALYSDLGHCGRGNIRISWTLVKSCLLLNYFGQGAWLMEHNGEVFGSGIPFYGIMPKGFLFYGICIATAATVIASQAMITGAFTTISEAMKLNIWPKVKINHTSTFKGQIFVPSINWLLMFSCLGVVLYFKRASNMEAAYGLAINIGMLMTTSMFSYYLLFIKKTKFIWVIAFLFVYLIVEGSFLTANLAKFTHGGYITVIIMSVVISIMFVWYKSKRIKNRLTEFVDFTSYTQLLNELSTDPSVPKYSTHLVYLTGAATSKHIETKIIYSIFQKQPKKADVYWFLHVEVVDEPYVLEYKVEIIVPNDVIRIDFKLGFRMDQKINLYFRKVVEDLLKDKEIDFTSRYNSLNKRNVIGDFRFVVLEKHLSNENNLPLFDRIIMRAYFFLKAITQSEQNAFGLETSNVTVEKVPIMVSKTEEIKLKRIR